MIKFQGDYYNPAAISAIIHNDGEKEFSVYLYGSEQIIYDFDTEEETINKMREFSNLWINAIKEYEQR